TDLGVCVIIPTYNNQHTLKRVINGVLELTNNLIVVNDGSTDTTSSILKAYPNIQQVHFPENKGKGVALRAGFKHAISLGYKFAITIDSDGQHVLNDIPHYINELEQNQAKDSVNIGARNMSHESVPGKSNFGNKFTNFWLGVETGTKLQDTQSGFRLYPLNF